MDKDSFLNEEAEYLASANPDWKEIEQGYSSQREAIEVAQLQEELDSKKQDRIQRKEYANKIYWLLCVYILVVMLLLYFCAFRLTKLSSEVLIAIITTMTANVIGIFVFVAKYLFHTKE